MATDGNEKTIRSLISVENTAWVLSHPAVENVRAPADGKITPTKFVNNALDGVRSGGDASRPWKLRTLAVSIVAVVLGCAVAALTMSRTPVADASVAESLPMDHNEDEMAATLRIATKAQEKIAMLRQRSPGWPDHTEHPASLDGVKQAKRLADESAEAHIKRCGALMERMLRELQKRGEVSTGDPCEEEEELAIFLKAFWQVYEAEAVDPNNSPMEQAAYQALADATWDELVDAQNALYICSGGEGPPNPP